MSLCTLCIDFDQLFIKGVHVLFQLSLLLLYVLQILTQRFNFCLMLQNKHLCVNIKYLLLYS